MIIVSGTGRSGTSMWMQVLQKAGFPVLGEAFPLDWRETYFGANVRGFYESSLGGGVNFTSNPNPTNGAHLDPETSRDVVAKVFLLGVGRTRFAFLDNVILTARGWRDYCASLSRAYAILAETGNAPETPALPHIRWWVEHYVALRDIRERGLPVRMVAYEDVLARPERIGDVLDWIGLPCDAEAAIASIDPGLRTQADVATPDGVPQFMIEPLDEMYDHLRNGTAATPAWLDRAWSFHREVMAILAVHVNDPWQARAGG